MEAPELLLLCSLFALAHLVAADELVRIVDQRTEEEVVQNASDLAFEVGLKLRVTFHLDTQVNSCCENTVGYITLLFEMQSNRIIIMSTWVLAITNKSRYLT